MSQDYSRVLHSSPSSPSSPFPGLSEYAMEVLDLGRGYRHSILPSYLPLDRHTSDSSVSSESFEYPAGQMDFDDADSQDIRHTPIRRETSIFIGGPGENICEESLSDRSLPICPRCDQNLQGRTQRQHEAEGCVAIPIPRTSHVVPQATPFFPGSPPPPGYMVQAMGHLRHHIAPAQVPGASLLGFSSKYKSPANASQGVPSPDDVQFVGLDAEHGFTDEGVDVGVPTSYHPGAPSLPPGLGGLFGFSA